MGSAARNQARMNCEAIPSCANCTRVPTLESSKNELRGTTGARGREEEQATNQARMNCEAWNLSRVFMVTLSESSKNELRDEGNIDHWVPVVVGNQARMNCERVDHRISVVIGLYRIKQE